MDIFCGNDLHFAENKAADSSLAELFGLTAPAHRDSYSLALTRLEKGGTVVRHHHAASEEIYLFTEGRCTMAVEGTRIDAAPGTVVAIRPGEQHEILPCPEAAAFYALSIPPYRPEDFLTEEAAQNEL